MKACTQCGETKPLELFSPLKRGRGGRHAWCRACSLASAKARYASNVGGSADKVRARSRARAAADPTAKKAQDRAYYDANSDRIRARVRRTIPKVKFYGSPRRRATTLDRRALKLGVPYCAAAVVRIEELAALAVVACHWCERWMVCGAENVDHRIPLIRGGLHAPSNLVPSCEACNKSKGSLLPDEWKARRAVRGH